MYTFNEIGDYKTLVVPLNDGSFEAIVYEFSLQNPTDYKLFDSKLSAKDWAVKLANQLTTINKSDEKYHAL